MYRFLSSLCLFLSIGLLPVYGKGQPKEFKNGVLNLGALRGLDTEVIPVRGLWEFYWGKLLPPDSISAGKYKPHFLEVPLVWSDYIIDGKSLPVHGVATYKLTLLNPQRRGDLQIKFMAISSSCKIWMNSTLVAQQGLVGTTPETSEAQRLNVYLDIPNADTVTLVVQVSNFHCFIGGINYQVDLGRRDMMQDHSRFFENWEMVLTGIVLMMVIFNLVMHVQLNRGTSFLLLAMICFIILFRALAVYDGSLLIYRLIPSARFVVVKKIEFLLSSMTVFLIPMFMRSMFPKDTPQWAVLPFQIVGGLLSLAFLIVPVGSYALLVTPFYLVVIVAFAVTSIIAFKVVKEQRLGAKIILAGVLIEASLTTFEILKLMGFIEVDRQILPNATTVGVIIFLIFFSAAVSAQFSSALHRIEKMSASLEKKVEERTNELSTANHLKNKLFSIIAHDLRSPLNTLFSMVNAIASDLIKDSEVKELMKPIKENLQSNRQMLENLLSWSTVQMNGMVCKQEKVHLLTLANENLNLYRNELKVKNIQALNTVPENMIVFADLNMLRIIIRNLISNAIKFTPSAGTITISAEGNDNVVSVSVEDTGVGMTTEQCNNLFSIGTNMSTLGTNSERGTGIGLLLCKEFVERNNGTINVLSEKGKGTRFTFSLQSAVT